MHPEKLEGTTVTRHGTDECEVYFSKYTNNNRVAIVLQDKETGEPYATASVNVVHADLKPDEVAIKDYSEGEGMLNDLVAAGIVEDTGKTVPSGYVDIPIARLLKKPSWLKT